MLFTVMRTTVKALKRLIREASIAQEKYMTEDDAEQYIAARDGDTIAKFDIIDEESDEVYIRQDDPFNTSPFNPDHRVDMLRCEKDKKYAERTGNLDTWEEMNADPEEEEPYDWEAEEDKRREDEDARQERAQQEYEKAVEEFAESMSEAHLDYPDQDPQNICYDLADSFFWHHPDEWEEWASALGRSRSSIKEELADRIYDAMLRHDENAA